MTTMEAVQFLGNAWAFSMIGWRKEVEEKWENVSVTPVQMQKVPHAGNDLSIRGKVYYFRVIVGRRKLDGLSLGSEVSVFHEDVARLSSEALLRHAEDVFEDAMTIFMSYSSCACSQQKTCDFHYMFREDKP